MAGKYSPTAGVASASECTDCPAGKYSPTAGTVSESTCADCEAGKYSPTAGAVSESTCADCDAGKYSNATGNMTCGGSCGCVPSERESGTFSDGSGDSNYDNNEDCWWLIAAEGEIRISFSSFRTENSLSDSVHIYECDTAACELGRRVEIARLYGACVSLSDEYSSSTGFLKVTFTSDSYITSWGFTGTWSISAWGGATGCTNCISGTYSAAIGAPSIHTCTSCPAGKFSAEGASVGLPVRCVIISWSCISFVDTLFPMGMYVYEDMNMHKADVYAYMLCIQCIYTYVPKKERQTSLG